MNYEVAVVEGVGSDVDEENKTREAIKKFFPSMNPIGPITENDTDNESIEIKGYKRILFSVIEDLKEVADRCLKKNMIEEHNIFKNRIAELEKELERHYK